MRAAKKTMKPYTLVMGGSLVGFYKTLEEARTQADLINRNRVRSSDDETMRQHVKVTYESHESSYTAFED